MADEGPQGARVPDADPQELPTCRVGTYFDAPRYISRRYVNKVYVFYIIRGKNRLLDGG